MSLDDAIPEPVLLDERSKRRTTELCGDDHDGYRCMLLKGHAGLHEAIANVGPVRWLPTTNVSIR